MNSQACELGPYSKLPDELILAAIERAVRHGDDPAWIVTVGEHLGFKRTPHGTRRLRERLEHLRVTERCLERHERQGREYWSLTPTGADWLEALRHEGRLGALPESPQHRRWRHAREAARRQIDTFERLVTAALDEAYDALRHHTTRGSETWLGLGEQLGAALWLLGSATYCLGEWEEPDDARADVDENPGPPPVRRAISAWQEKEATAKGARR